MAIAEYVGIFLLAYMTLTVYNFDMECASKAKGQGHSLHFFASSATGSRTFQVIIRIWLTFR